MDTKFMDETTDYCKDHKIIRYYFPYISLISIYYLTRQFYHLESYTILSFGKLYLEDKTNTF